MIRDSRWLRTLSQGEWRRLCTLALAVVALHVVGLVLLFVSAPAHPVLQGLGWSAYLFGLRHAFDADHIAAIDNTTRKLMGEGKRPLGVGFWFSLGHSTVVLALTLSLALATRAVHGRIPLLQHYGGAIGTSVSGAFLCAIGVVNLLVLVGILRVARELRRGGDRTGELGHMVVRGPMSRVFGGLLGLVRVSWHMYPVGLLFGLGFDTASEIGLLGLSAGAASGQISIGGVLSLPILFAAGMSLMDSADGAFMTHAYGWAFSNPVRKLYYNITVTGLSVAVALGVGSVELLQVTARRLSLSGGLWGPLARLDFGLLGYGIVGLALAFWAGSYAIWRFGRIEQRWSAGVTTTAEPP